MKTFWTGSNENATRFALALHSRGRLRLGVTAEAIKNFSEEAVINIISSTLHDNAGSVNNNCTLNFNPMDKLLEVIEENKKLYERLLQSEREKVELLKAGK